MMDSSHKKFRRESCEVKVGSIGIGGKNPIRIQSMTTTLTHEIEATISQILKLVDYGCEIARVTVQGMREALACEKIKNTLIKMGVDIPIVADIHFYPPAAMQVVEFVDKVRINPGNFLDKRASFKIINYDSDLEYQAEVDRIFEGFSPLVQKCLSLNKAMRIGVNHGSLSDRIMSRYGDTPYGMVESAIEYARVCRAHGFHNFLFSMKSSHPKIMIESYRLLVKRMEELNWNYPLHLGVTEAGLGEDGRIKSSIGIGTLLLDGIGDTIRVSLTEDPWEEIQPAREMIKQFEIQRSYNKNNTLSFQTNTKKQIKLPLYLHEKGSVLLKLTKEELDHQDFLSSIGLFYQNGKYQKEPSAADAVFSSEPISDTYLEILKRSGVEYIPKEKIKEIHLDENELNLEDPSILKAQLILAKFSSKSLHQLRSLCEKLDLYNLKIPIIASSDYGLFSEESIIQASMEFGSFLINGLINGLQIDFKGSLKQKREFAFNILQGCGLRAIKTEYIACPGCGRTLFNLQDVTKLIQEKTKHLPGVKIAVMGCIVNGPGEMADADFGYVGSKTNQIDLYVRQKCVERNIPSEHACDKLIELIKKEGKWIDP